MADFKRRTLSLSTGKQIKLFGNSLAIGKSLEIGEGGAPNIFSCFASQDSGNSGSVVSNPFRLTADELHEIADYNIQLWIELKNNIRLYGTNNIRLFNTEKLSESNAPLKKGATDRS